MKYKKDLLNEGTVRHKELQHPTDRPARHKKYHSGTICKGVNAGTTRKIES